MLGDQMIQRIEFVHSNNFLHRDIKPDNFLMGSGSNQHILYIIDFGLSKRFIDPKTGKHIPYIDGKSLTGTARYASLNTHIGHEQARRDDIESIAFVMIYFIKGKLPWQGVSGKNKEEKYKKIKERKIDTPITELSRGLPPQFLKFFELVRNIGFEDAPDYAALRTLLADMFTEKNYENDFMYDWVIKSQEHSKKSRVHSQVQERKNEFNKPKNNYKGRNEHELQHHKNSYNDESKQIENYKNSYFGNKKYSKQKQAYDPTPLDNIYPIKEERFYKTSKKFYQKEGDYNNNYKEETKESNI